MQSPNLQHRITRGTIPSGRIDRISSGTSRPYNLVVSKKPLMAIKRESIQMPHLGRFLMAMVGLFLLALLAAPLYSNSATMAEQSAIARIDGGQVNILRAHSRGIETLNHGSQINIQVNDMVSAETGTAIVQFFGDQLVSMHPSSRLTVERYDINELGKRLEYMVWGGHILHESRQSAGASDWIHISTPSSSASVRNATVSVHVIDPDQTVYSVQEGVAWITMGDQEVFLAPNQGLFAIADQPLTVQSLTAESPTAYGAVQAIESSNTDLPRQSSGVNQGNVEQQETAATSKTIGDLLADSNKQIVQSQLIDNQAWQLHIVEPGDSFWTIASEHAIPVDLLTQANPELSDRSILIVGQRVRIPVLIN